MSSTPPLTVADLDQYSQHIEDVFVRSVLVAYRITFDLVATEATVELHATDRRQVVAVSVKNRLWNRFCAASLVGGSPDASCGRSRPCASSCVVSGRSMRSVSEMNGPRSRSLVNSVRTS